MATVRVLMMISAALLIGCAARVADPRAASKPILNEQGHVIGHKNGGAEPVYYTPRYDATGSVVAYEEPVPEGVVIRALDGRRIGVRYQDLRSRGTNQNNDGVTVTVPRDQSQEKR